MSLDFTTKICNGMNDILGSTMEFRVPSKPPLADDDASNTVTNDHYCIVSMHCDGSIL